MKKQMQLVRCTVNGREVEEYVDVREPLLDMLRNRLGLTSVKKGCEVGECGRRLMTHIKRELIRWMKPRKLQRMRFGRCVTERQVTFGLISQMEQM